MFGFALLTVVVGLGCLVNDAAQSSKQLRVGFAPLERLVFEGLSDDPLALITWAGDCASALVAADREGAPLRFISRTLAAERARMIVLEAMLDKMLVEQNWFAVREIKGLIAMTAKILCGLIREHTAASSVGHRAVVVAVAHANNVHVSPSEK